MSEALITGNPKKRKRIEETCILCNEACSEQCTLKYVGWKSLQQKSELWVGLDTFGKVAETVDWNVSPESYLMHAQCKIKLYNSKALDQAKKRKERLEKPCNEDIERSQCQSENETEKLSRNTRKSFDGIIHSKDLCIWCMKPEDKRHKNRNYSKLHLIDQVSQKHFFIGGYRRATIIISSLLFIINIYDYFLFIVEILGAV